MIRSRCFAILIGAALMASGTQGAFAAAQATTANKSPPLPAFEQIDKDGNGVVTMPEVDVYPDAIAARLRKCDVDRDMQVSHEEYAQCEQDAHKSSRK